MNEKYIRTESSLKMHRMMRNCLFSLVFLSLFIIIAPVPSVAEDLELINRPVNSGGLTGLLFTTSPFTIPAGTVELSSSVTEEKSDRPEYTINELPSLSLTYGISDAMEMAVRSSYVHEKDADGVKERGAGNTELSYKWNFLPQDESSLMPALALTVTGIYGAGDEKIVLEGVSYWGARAGLSAGREIEWGEHVIGLFADCNIVVNDLNRTEQRDRYTVVNAGLIIPISKYRNLQMMVEYSVISGVNRLRAEGDDYSAISSGLRLVTERFNFSIGTQFLDKRSTGVESANRMLGMAGVKF